MSNCPKCPECLKEGRLNNTYRLWGKVGPIAYKCGLCHKHFPHTSFEKESFLWLEDSDTWKAWMERNGHNLKTFGVA